MSEAPENLEESLEQKRIDPALGQVEWLDLTVGDASRIKSFYQTVVGWKASEVDMGSYSDFNMNSADGKQTVAGICHARGLSSNLPAKWLAYVRVEDVTKSAELCTIHGGKILDGPRRMGGSDLCVIEDPEGAVIALLS
ncbi:MAG: VOC family protein [Gammaproteobacteria bacterium]|nr:VOC family protein [Gammaproteobacteria bacterium]MDG1489461.1 VOC family protein [Actinomycetota bacterium]MDG1952288.1 VOC family protein [Gammaproteobacteria bacterium]MDG2118728.1 VOC family protein [Gammaproteobacteria bacterium]